MDTKKEILLYIASTLTAFGATILATDWRVGTFLLLLGGAVFVGRGYYKKYVDKE